MLEALLGLLVLNISQKAKLTVNFMCISVDLLLEQELNCLSILAFLNLVDSHIKIPYLPCICVLWGRLC